MGTQAPYVLDNDEPTASPMLDHLSAILDGFTIERLTEAGVPAGGRCWEVGAGNGSISSWLGEQVGAGGTVIATDIKPQHVRHHARVRIVTHDVAGQPPPDLGFGLMHARLVLAHLPTRRQVVKTLAEALAPGGALVIEEWGQWSGMVLSSPVPDAAAIYGRYTAALLEVFRSFGNDPTWAAQVPQAMADAGLVEVDTVCHADSWRGGSAGCLLPVVVSTELRGHLIGAGARAEDLDALPEIMHHPDTLVLGNLTFSTIGRRPSAADRPTAELS